MKLPAPTIPTASLLPSLLLGAAVAVPVLGGLEWSIGAMLDGDEATRAWRMVAWIAAMTAGGCLSAASALWRRASAGRRRETALEDAVTEARLALESHTRERTADLSATNRRLTLAMEAKDRADRAKNRFLTAANHDLRQPVQAARLFHHLLSRRLTQPEDRALSEKLGAALESGEAILRALMEMATLDAGVVRPNVTPFPVNAILADVAASFRDPALAKGLRLRVLSQDAIVRSDRGILRAMLGALVGNAITYTRQGGVVIGCRRRGDTLRIEVWDSGDGIAPEHLETIFEDFVQLGNPERNAARGLGIGLAKLRRKAGLLGHTVEVHSRPGHGSRFTLIVPMAGDGCESPPTRQPLPSPASASPSAEANKKDGERLILVVEDDPDQRLGVRLLLEAWGHRVMAASDGRGALALLASGPAPDVVVSDFRLPGPLNGVQVVAQVGETVGWRVPGIILTGDTAPERLREALASGCRLLHKPWEPARLREALAAFVEPRPTTMAPHRDPSPHRSAA